MVTQEHVAEAGEKRLRHVPVGAVRGRCRRIDILLLRSDTLRFSYTASATEQNVNGPVLFKDSPDL